MIDGARPVVPAIPAVPTGAPALPALAAAPVVSGVQPEGSGV